jgi:hypothetical protein
VERRDLRIQRPFSSSGGTAKSAAHGISLKKGKDSGEPVVVRARAGRQMRSTLDVQRGKVRFENYIDVTDTIRQFMRRRAIIMTVINGFTFDRYPKR